MLVGIIVMKSTFLKLLNFMLLSSISTFCPDYNYSFISINKVSFRIAPICINRSRTYCEFAFAHVATHSIQPIHRIANRYLKPAWTFGNVFPGIVFAPTFHKAYSHCFMDSDQYFYWHLLWRQYDECVIKGLLKQTRYFI